MPLAVIWRAIGSDAFRYLPDYTGLLPFSTISALSVMGVVEWARSADRRIRTIVLSPAPRGVAVAEPLSRQDDEPSLLRRLDPAFSGPILALQSEDHYVRVTA